MKDKIGLYVGFVFITLGLVKFDIYIYNTLDYFGKFVAVGVLNIFPFWIGFMVFDKFRNNEKFKIVLPFIWGLTAGIVFYLL